MFWLLFFSCYAFVAIARSFAYVDILVDAIVFVITIVVVVVIVSVVARVLVRAVVVMVVDVVLFFVFAMIAALAITCFNLQLTTSRCVHSFLSQVHHRRSCSAT